MKIVIDIDEDYFEILKHDVAHGNNYKPFELIANGTPLDDIRSEILTLDDEDYMYEYRKAIIDVLQIIDDTKGGDK